MLDGWAGLSIGIIGVFVYIAVVALSIWIGYLILRTAVKNGVIRAHDEMALRGMSPVAPYSPPQPGAPQQPGPPQYPGQ